MRVRILAVLLALAALPAAASDIGCVLEDQLVPPTPAQAAGVVLRQFTFPFNGVQRQVLLLRLPTADGRSTYAEWIPPTPGSGPTSAVLLTIPYDGIDWTGEAVDQRWAANCPTGSCSLPDTDGPWGGPTATPIGYTKLTPEKFAQEQATGWLLNGMGVLGVYGRYYAGNTFWTQAQDMVAGLRFLATQPTVDKQRVGVSGASLGGFGAFYAAAYAPPNLKPAALAPMVPPVDLAGEIRWAVWELPALAQTQARRDQAAVFFNSYIRRAWKDTGGLPGSGGDYRCFDAAKLAARVSGQVLITADDWDLLVDPARTSALISLLGARAQPLWYLHTTAANADTLPLDHGPFDGAFGFATWQTFLYPFIAERVGNGWPIIAPYQLDLMATVLVRWRDQKRQGLAQPGAAQRLADLADPRVVMWDLPTNSMMGGADWVSAAVSAIWGVQVPAANVEQYLRTNGLPP